MGLFGIRTDGMKRQISSSSINRTSHGGFYSAWISYTNEEGKNWRWIFVCWLWRARGNDGGSCEKRTCLPVHILWNLPTVLWAPFASCRWILRSALLSFSASSINSDFLGLLDICQGRYLPVFSSEVYDQNEIAKKEGREILNLTSIIIGNGITDISTWVHT